MDHLCFLSVALLVMANVWHVQCTCVTGSTTYQEGEVTDVCGYCQCLGGMLLCRDEHCYCGKDLNGCCVQEGEPSTECNFGKGCPDECEICTCVNDTATCMTMGAKECRQTLDSHKKKNRQ